MKVNTRKLILVVLATILVVSALLPTLNAKSVLTPIPVYVDGVRVAIGETYLINDVAMIPLRALVQEFSRKASCSWDNKTRTTTVKIGGNSIIATEKLPYIIANGRYLASDTENCILNDKLYVPVRSLAKAFGATVTWDNDARQVRVRSGSGAISSGGAYYNAEDVYWLSRIIQAESGSEPLRGKIAVGNVVMNRVRSRECPNTIYGVIFDMRYGVQFTPAATGTIYNTPSAESVIAAKICLDGYSISTKVLYFVNEALAGKNWVSSCCDYQFRIGNHKFFS